MGILGNILWHFPFLGFVFGIWYFVWGAIFSVTVIFLPIGKGLLELAKFMMAPFSNKMVHATELKYIGKYNKGSIAQAADGIIQILYFPFGLVSSIAGVCLIVCEALSIIGIPSAIVWSKALRTIFNPVGMVCISNSEAALIEQMKIDIRKGKIKLPKTPEEIDSTMKNNETKENNEKKVEPELNPKYSLLNYDKANGLSNSDIDRMLNEQIEDLNPKYVETLKFVKAEREAEVSRNESRNKAYSSSIALSAEERAARLSEPALYNENQINALSYIKRCEECRIEPSYDGYIATFAAGYVAPETPAEKLQREEVEKEAEKKKLAAIKKRKAAQKEKEKNQRKALVFIAIILAMAIGIALYFNYTSSGYRYTAGIEALMDGDSEKGLELLNLIPKDAPEYSDAQISMYYEYKHKDRLEESSRALFEAVDFDSFDSNREAAELYTEHLLSGDYMPHILQDSIAAAMYMSTSDNSSILANAGLVYAKCGEYATALRIFNQFSKYDSRYNDVQGYMGLIYTYQGDLSKAKACLGKATASVEYLVRLGDLSLILSNEYYLARTARTTALDYYDQARKADPDSKAASLRWTICNNIKTAYEKALLPGGRYSHNWANENSYSFVNNGGRYVGEVARGATGLMNMNGWGCASYNTKCKSLMIGHTIMLKQNGLNLFIKRTDNGSYYSFVGEYKSGRFTEGIYTDSDGVERSGKFNHTKLLEGKVKGLFDTAICSAEAIMLE